MSTAEPVKVPIAADPDNEWKPCCPRFDPSSVDETKEIELKQKPFVKESTYCFFGIPFNFGGAVTRCFDKLRAVDAIPAEDTGLLVLADHSSPFLADIYVASKSDKVPNATMHHISGKFLTKVFEGPYKECCTFDAQMKKLVKDKTGQEPLKMYTYYTSCPRCAKHYGANYMVLYAQVAE